MFAWQAWNAEDSGDEVLAMVVRTGLHTQMGVMVRELVDPSKLPADNDPFVRVGLLFVSV